MIGWKHMVLMIKVDWLKAHGTNDESWLAESLNSIVRKSQSKTIFYSYMIIKVNIFLNLKKQRLKLSQTKIIKKAQFKKSYVFEHLLSSSKIMTIYKLIKKRIFSFYLKFILFQTMPKCKILRNCSGPLHVPLKMKKKCHVI